MRFVTQGRIPIEVQRRLLAGVATFALLAAGSAYTFRAYSADALLAGTPFGASSAARAPAMPIVMPGFTDLVTAVKPAVVSVRVKADATAHRVGDGDDGNPLEGSPFERFFKDFRGPNGRKMMPGQEGVVSRANSSRVRVPGSSSAPMVTLSPTTTSSITP